MPLERSDSLGCEPPPRLALVAHLPAGADPARQEGGGLGPAALRPAGPRRRPADARGLAETGQADNDRCHLSGLARLAASPASARLRRPLARRRRPGPRQEGGGLGPAALRPAGQPTPAAWPRRVRPIMIDATGAVWLAWLRSPPLPPLPPRPCPLAAASCSSPKNIDSPRVLARRLLLKPNFGNSVHNYVFERWRACRSSNCSFALARLAGYRKIEPAES